MNEASGLPQQCISANFMVMPARFKVLKALDENSTTTLKLVRDSQLKSDFLLCRFKTKDPAELEGLGTLFSQLAALDCPRLDKIIEHATDDKGFYTLSPGPQAGISLPQMLERGPLDAEEFETLAMQLLEALEVIHDQSIVHGTLTPDCVRITGVKTADWQVVLGGFGQGFALKGTEEAQQITAYRCTAPEQWQKLPARRRTDIYALGCVLYEALTARPAFQARTLKELRGKHIGHDIADLSKLATHVPRWMSAWVMSLLTTDAEARPRKASVARESFLLRDAAPPPVTQQMPEPPPPPPAVPPVTSAPVMLPVTQPARQATARTIPIAVGPQIVTPAPKRAMPVPTYSKPAARSVSQQPVGRPLWKKPVPIAMTAILLIGIIWLIQRSSPQPSTSKAAAAPRQYDAPSTSPSMQKMEPIGSFQRRAYASGVTSPAPPYPAGFTQPFAAAKLIMHLHADFGVCTYSGATADKPAREGDVVALWHDLGPMSENNAMAAVPWLPANKRTTLRTLQPDAAKFPLRGPRRFVVFNNTGQPITALGSIGFKNENSLPFADANINGITMATLFYVTPTPSSEMQFPARISFKGDPINLLTHGNTAPWLVVEPSTPNSKGVHLAPASDKAFDCTKPTLAMVTLGRDGNATAIFRNSAGQRDQSTSKSKPLSKALQNIALGGDAYWAFRDKGVATYAFYGGIAEFRLYNGLFNANDLKKLEDELVERYFP